MTSRTSPRWAPWLWLVLVVIGVLWILANALAVATALRHMPPGDWENYYAAGVTAGTPTLLDPVLHRAWQVAHHFPVFQWQYMPGAAWLFAPFAGIGVTKGYAIFFVLMTVAATASALILARIYLVGAGTAVLATFAWVPTTTGIIFGQSAPLGLLFESLGITGIVTGSAWLTGVSVGLLLYKPTNALPFVVLLAVRRWWGALTIVALCAVGWYAASALAAAGDTLWLPHYLQAQRRARFGYRRNHRASNKHSEAFGVDSRTAGADRCICPSHLRARCTEIRQGTGTRGREHRACHWHRGQPTRVVA
jgi:Glycosyltransferase family 87